MSQSTVSSHALSSRFTIPDPITPPPSMATFLIGAGAIPSMRGKRPADLVLRNMPMRFLATSDTAQSEKRSASRSISASISNERPFSTASMALKGAMYPLAFVMAINLAPFDTAFSSAALGKRLYRKRVRLPSNEIFPDMNLSAAATAVGTRFSGSATSSTSLLEKAFSASIDFPTVIISRALGNPMSRGSR